MEEDDSCRCAPNVLIIGASRDIGFELAKKYASVKSRIMIVSRNEVDLEIAADSVRSSGAREITIMAADVTDREQVDNVLDAAQSMLKCIDVIVYNAGESMQACFRSIENVDDFDSVASVNYTALLYTARRAVEILSRPVNRNAYRPYECSDGRRRGVAQFVATVGIGGQTGIPEWSLYSGAKHAAVGFLETLRRQVADDVEVAIAYPNMVESSRTQNMILADGTRAGPLGQHVLDMWWYQDELFYQPTEEAAKRYFEGIRGHSRDIYLHRLDKWASTMRRYSPEMADLLHFLAFRVSTRSWEGMPLELVHALQEARNLHKAFKLCSAYDPCVANGSSISLPDIIKITATRKRIKRQVDLILHRKEKEEEEEEEVHGQVQKTSQTVPTVIAMAKRKPPVPEARRTRVAPVLKPTTSKAEPSRLRSSPVVTLPESFLSSMQ